jgi:hypothetical protein
MANKRINVGKVILGGLVAGLVMNVLDFVVHGLLLGQAWFDAVKALGLDPAANQGGSALGWITIDFLGGIAAVALHAGLRTRFGATPRTAAIAGFWVWAVSHIMFASYATMKILPWSLVIWGSLGSLPAAVVGAMAGAYFYKEK